MENENLSILTEKVTDARIEITSTSVYKNATVEIKEILIEAATEIGNARYLKGYGVQREVTQADIARNPALMEQVKEGKLKLGDMAWFDKK